MKQTGSDNERCFVIGDIHGCAKTLEKLLFDELNIIKDDRIIFVGDYIDRGPLSKEVIDCILKLKDENYNLITLRGNHEQLFIWFNNGGQTTLANFEIFNYKELESKYKTFFRETIFNTAYKNFLIVHAGFDFTGDDFLEDKDAMIWIRDMKIDDKKLGNKIIIHGHTPTPVKKVNKHLKEINYSKELNIDTGCVYSNNGYNHLTAIELNTLQLISVRNID